MSVRCLISAKLRRIVLMSVGCVKSAKLKRRMVDECQMLYKCQVEV